MSTSKIKLFEKGLTLSNKEATKKKYQKLSFAANFF